MKIQVKACAVNTKKAQIQRRINAKKEKIQNKTTKKKTHWPAAMQIY